MAMLVVLKVIATATCYGSGNAGGIFGPSLFIGAMQTTMTPVEALDRVEGSRWNAWPLSDEKGLLGMVNLEDLLKAWDQGGDTARGEALDVRAGPHLHDDHLLDLALERMGAAGMDVLPVDSRLDLRRLEGIVGLANVMRV